MITVAVVSLKGGVGKTTVTLGLAGAAARRGVGVLVADLDAQANATTVLDPPPSPSTVVDALEGRSGSAARMAAPTGWGDLVRVLAAEPGLARQETAGATDPLRLRRALLHLEDGYADGAPAPGIVLLDCPPALGHLTRAALAAADRALVVTEPSLFALHGAAQALDAVEGVRQSANLRLAAAGIVVNRVRPRAAEHRYRLDELRRAFPGLLLDPPVLDRGSIQQAAGAYAPVHALRTPGAREAARAFDAHLAHLLATDLDSGPLAKRGRDRKGRR
ncbi:cellulose biosynthesis protein BcsQ [Motilibacter rhizosphaerae]|uniref:Cellulose biosynthesis protein BcsQ n=1 Tax=Motilibacter rhizosphaerae TaxID=598652 RepID=A0A4Q7NQI5_9ACTN|nr:ParA family protein [Motilibacter rhizosphaerae]RZS87483.1 cellulose biosynthesis protein BcsQ [Motilibacter rhizosphaerae]